MSIQIHTDGSCHNNPGPGGYAAILRYEDGSPEAVVTGGEPSTTSNRMELTAALAALQKAVETPDPGGVTIYTDSQYLCRGFNEGWVEKWKNNGWINAKRQPAKNRDIWEQISDLRDRIGEVAFVHVTGHSGNKLNERCDRLANEAADRAGRNIPKTPRRTAPAPQEPAADTGNAQPEPKSRGKRNAPATEPDAATAETPAEEQQDAATAETPAEEQQDAATAETPAEEQQETVPAETPAEEQQETVPAETPAEEQQETVPAETPAEEEQDALPSTTIAEEEDTQRAASEEQQDALPSTTIAEEEDSPQAASEEEQDALPSTTTAEEDSPQTPSGEEQEQKPHDTPPEEPAGEEQQQDPQPPLSNPFQCHPHPRGTRVITPLIGPDSQPIEVYLVESHGTLYVTDLAETIGAMAPPEKHGLDPQEAQATIRRICRDLHLKVSDRHLITMPSEEQSLSDSAFRLAQGRVQMLQMLTTAAIRRQLAQVSTAAQAPSQQPAKAPEEPQDPARTDNPVATQQR